MPLHSLSYPSKPVVGEDDKARNPRHVLIYFIPGNPGLIDYYAPFLVHLRELLDSTRSLSSSSTRFHIYGQDLAGFSDDDGHEPFTPQRKPFDLEYQIQLALKTVESMRVLHASGDGSREGHRYYDDVLLMGHSVGSYIALQLCHRTFLREPKHPNYHYKLDKGVLLFPTIVHIARSPAGRRLDVIRRTPGLEANAYRLAQLFLALWTYAALHWFIRTIMGFPAHAAEVTARWLGSRDGVWQALHMGIDELRLIREDVWDEELWGIEREAEALQQEQEQHQEQRQVVTAPVPRFYFFFGKKDHWVADHYRDIFIEKRRKQIERTRLIVDEGGLPHAFCVRHSETVAEKVCTWIQEIYSNQ